MASEMLSKVLDAENSDKEAQKAAHEQAQKTVDAAVEAARKARFSSSESLMQTGTITYVFTLE